jgi:hypothetical protein
VVCSPRDAGSRVANDPQRAASGAARLRFLAWEAPVASVADFSTRRTALILCHAVKTMPSAVASVADFGI